MASLLEIIVPVRVRKVEMTEPLSERAGDGASHKTGFEAGYEEGRLRAQWEALRSRQQEKERLEKLVRTLESLHREFESLLSEHMPDLIHGAVNRVFRKHRFTAEEISGEVAALLCDMEQAGKIALECAPAEIVELSKRLEEYDLIPDRSKWTMDANPNLQPGEFVLKSDLGDVDGRHSSRIRQIRMVLEAA